MKKLIIALSTLFSLSAYSQPGNLDTVNVASFTLPAHAWAYLASYSNGSSDSADLQFVRRVRTAALAVPNLTWNSNVTLTNVPGKYIVSFYDIVRRIPASEAIQVGASIPNAVNAVTSPVVQYYIGAIDARHQAEYLRHRQLGKALLIDN